MGPPYVLPNMQWDKFSSHLQSCSPTQILQFNTTAKVICEIHVVHSLSIYFKKLKQTKTKSQRPVWISQIRANSHVLFKSTLITLPNHLWICTSNLFLYLSFSSAEIMPVTHTWLPSCDTKLNSFSALQCQKRLRDEWCHSMLEYFCVWYGFLIFFQNEHTFKGCSDFCISNNVLLGMSKLKI